MGIIKLLMKQRRMAFIRNDQNIISCLSYNPNARLLDLGCDDGAKTKILGKTAGTNQLFGVEIVEERRKVAEELGIKVSSENLNATLKYDNEYFDIIHSNQVIEHLSEIDVFLSEIHRILKSGGYLILSTENLASWHNIFALVLGYMPFSLTNVTQKTADLGNPLAPNNNNKEAFSYSLLHKTVFTTKGLIHLLELYGFSIDKVIGSGYYPFGNLFSRLDPFHSAVITLKAIKKSK